MSDAAVDMLASNLFGLSTTNFHAVNSESRDTSDEAVALAADGDLACHNEFNKGDEVSNEYVYCGTALSTHLGTFLTSFGKVYGTGAAAVVTTELSLDFPGPGQQAHVTIRGHKHTTNNHSATTNPPRTFDVSGAVPAGAGLGVPAIFGSTFKGSDAEYNSASLAFSLEHVDEQGAAGAHFTGESRTAVCEASADFVGHAAGTGAAAAWKQVLLATSDAQDALDRSSATAHQWFAAS
jgi:hypothetical protein